MLNKNELKKLATLYEKDPLGKTLTEAEKANLIKEFERLIKLVFIKLGNHAPFWRGLIYTCKYFATFNEPTASVNIKREIYINPLLFLSCNINQQAFIIAHEVGHLAFNHLIRASEFLDKKIQATDKNGVTGSVELSKLAGIAMDYALNWMINESLGFEKDSCYPRDINGEVWILDKEEYRGKYFEEILADLVQKIKNQEFSFIFPSSLSNNIDKDQNKETNQPISEIQIDGINNHAFDTHDLDQKGLSKTEIDKQEAENKSILKNALNYAKQHGDIPKSLERLISELVEPKINWLDVLRYKLGKSIAEVSGKEDYSWRRPNRRLIHRNMYLPSMIAKELNIILGLDTSASMEEVLRLAVSEIIGLVNQFTGSSLWVISCDCTIKEVQKVHNSSEIDLIKLTKGGGGTSMTPIFEFIEENLNGYCDVLIIITDGFIDYVSEIHNQQETIWVIYNNSEFKPNFGETIYIDSEGNYQHVI